MKVRQKEPTQTKTKGESAVRWLGGGRGGVGYIYFLLNSQISVKKTFRFPIPKLNKLSLKSCCLSPSYKSLPQISFRENTHFTPR